MLNRKFTVCLWLAFVNVTEYCLSCFVHFAAYLSTVIKIPFICFETEYQLVSMKP